MIKDIFLGFVMLGFIEAIVKPVAMRFFQRKTIKYGAIAMKFIDERILDIDNDDQDLELRLKQYLEGVTNSEWNNRELDELFRIHDIRLALKKRQN